MMLLLFVTTACSSSSTPEIIQRSDKNFMILSSSENKALEPLLIKFGEQNNIHIQMKYMGSVDIMNELSKPNPPYDAVWVANSMWISMGDSQHLVKSTKSMMTSPIVFGIKESIAKQLGWVNQDVTMKEILQAIEQKKFTFAMTSATQSNSGASALFAFMNAMLGNPDSITSADLQNENLKKEMTSFLSGINRSSGSSDWLKDLFLQSNYDAMVNYEAVIMDTNVELTKQNREPLHLIYPVDGLAVADYPLGFIIHKEDSDKQQSKKEAFFDSLQDYLLKPDTQGKIADLGRRTSEMVKVNGALYNPAWGVDLNRTLTPIRYPAADVIRQTLSLYQTELKKPSITYFLLDYSGSMTGEGEEQLKLAMKALLDQNQAKANLLESSEKDKIVVIPFSSTVIDVWRAEGTKDLQKVMDQINNLQPGGGTNIYAPTELALNELAEENLEGYMPAIVLMTDGRSNEGSYSDAQQAYTAAGKDIPIFSITFGSADDSQLTDLANLSRARVFEGKTDLVGAFKTAKGYN
jgi:Ca-activated chloride channel homolog